MYLYRFIYSNVASTILVNNVYMQSQLFIVVGIVTTVAVTAACAAVLETFTHQIIEITQHGYQPYVAIQNFRYDYLQLTYVP